jgi:hypothetical protein
VIFVNGAQAGIGSWRADTLQPGSYRLSADVPASSACIWRSDTTSVVLPTPGVSEVVLRPRQCGSLQLTATNGLGGPVLYASFLVLAAADGLLHAGRTEGGNPVVLPAGTHWLEIQTPSCAKYSDSLHIVPDKVMTMSIGLICGPQLRRHPG